MRGGAGRGRGAARGGRGGEQDRKGKRKAEEDEELDEPEDGNGSYDSESPMEEDDEDTQSESEDDTETPAQKRLRLSQMYLKSLEKDTTGGEQLERRETHEVLICYTIQTISGSMRLIWTEISSQNDCNRMSYVLTASLLLWRSLTRSRRSWSILESCIST